MPTKIEISHKTIIFTVFFLIFLWLVLQIRDILIMLFISFIFMSALKPLVESLERLKIPRLFAILFVYLSLFGFFVIFLIFVFPPLIAQTSTLGGYLPKYVGIALPFLNLHLQTIMDQLAPLGENILRMTFSFFSNIFAVVTIFVFTFYFLLGRAHLRKFLVDFVGKEGEQKIIEIVRKIESQLGYWLRAQLTLCLIVGTASFLGLSLLRVNFALPLALLAGVLEIVPNLGPIISAVPAVLIATLTSPILGLAVIALYFIIQQLENTFIVPQVMKKTVGLPPLVTFLSLLIGVRIAGLAGAVLSVPTALTLQTLFSELFTTKK